MLLYPGGSYHDHGSKSYSFFLNFFSDLGRYKTFDGESKYISTILFCYAIGVLAVSVSFFIKPFLNQLPQSKNYKLPYYTAIISAFTFSIFIFGVACTPYDLVLQAHIISVRVAFISLVPLCLSLSYLIYKHDEIPNQYFYILVIVSILLTIYIYILFNGPKVKDNPYFQPVAQKVIVYSLSIAMLHIAHGAKKYLKNSI